MSVDTLYEHRPVFLHQSRETSRAQTGRGEGEARSSATGTSEGGVPGLACVPRSMLCSTGEEGTGTVLFRVDTTCQLVFGEGGGNECNREMFPVSSVDRL